MFNLGYEERLSKWRKFREQLESSSKPLNDVVQFYSLAPTVSIHSIVVSVKYLECATLYS